MAARAARAARATRATRAATRDLLMVGVLALAAAASTAAASTATASTATASTASASTATASAARSARAKTVVQTAQDGALSASFKFVERRYSYGGETLTISDNGQALYQAPVVAPQCAGRCAPGGGVGGTGSSAQFATLGAGEAPSLVLSLYSNYAHCCWIAQVFSPAANGGWSVSSHNFGDPGFRVSDLGNNGVKEFLTADDRFAYAFSDFAASGLPVQVLTYSNGQFENVTRSYPSLISRDAQVWLKAFRDQRRGHYEDTTGLLAAWAADEDELGHSAAVNRFLAEQAKAHHLNSGLGYVVPQGSRYVRALKRFLTRTGYLTT